MRFAFLYASDSTFGKHRHHRGGDRVKKTLRLFIARPMRHGERIRLVIPLNHLTWTALLQDAIENIWLKRSRTRLSCFE